MSAIVRHCLPGVSLEKDELRRVVHGFKSQITPSSIHNEGDTPRANVLEAPPGTSEDKEPSRGQFGAEETVTTQLEDYEGLNPRVQIQPQPNLGSPSREAGGRIGRPLIAGTSPESGGSDNDLLDDSTLGRSENDAQLPNTIFSRSTTTSPRPVTNTEDLVLEDAMHIPRLYPLP